MVTLDQSFTKRRVDLLLLGKVLHGLFTHQEACSEVLDDALLVARLGRSDDGHDRDEDDDQRRVHLSSEQIF